MTMQTTKTKAKAAEQKRRSNLNKYTLYDLPEISPVLHLGLSRLQELCRSGALQAQKINGRWRVTEQALQAFVAGRANNANYKADTKQLKDNNINEWAGKTRFVEIDGGLINLSWVARIEPYELKGTRWSQKLNCYQEYQRPFIDFIGYDANSLIAVEFKTQTERDMCFQWLTQQAHTMVWSWSGDEEAGDDGGSGSGRHSAPRKPVRL